MATGLTYMVEERDDVSLRVVEHLGDLRDMVDVKWQLVICRPWAGGDWWRLLDRAVRGSPGSRYPERPARESKNKREPVILGAWSREGAASDHPDLHPILSKLESPPRCSFCDRVIGRDGRPGVTAEADLPSRKFGPTICANCLELCIEIVEEDPGDEAV